MFTWRQLVHGFVTTLILIACFGRPAPRVQAAFKKGATTFEFLNPISEFLKMKEKTVNGLLLHCEGNEFVGARGLFGLAAECVSRCVRPISPSSTSIFWSMSIKPTSAVVGSLLLFRSSFPRKILFTSMWMSRASLKHKVDCLTEHFHFFFKLVLHDLDFSFSWSAVLDFTTSTICSSRSHFALRGGLTSFMTLDLDFSQ